MITEPSGFIEWHDWFFDYDIPDTDGLTLLHGHFAGQHIFTKLSLPVIRVKYLQDEDLLVHNHVLGNGCGPYNDQIKWDPDDVWNYFESGIPYHGPHQLVKIICGGEERYICAQEIQESGTTWLRLAVYARIGAYHIIQAWQLNDQGKIRPRVWSKGLSCNLDHWHHPYWRLHFRLGDTPRHKLDVYNGQLLAQAVAYEGPFVNAGIGAEPRYIISNLDNPFTVTITPPRLDRNLGIVGPDAGPQPFSTMDAYLRRFRPEEDRSWPKKQMEDLSFPFVESALGHELVFWSVCHLEHHAAEGAHHWHRIGPDIEAKVPRLRSPLPHEVRKVTVDCTFHVKDFKLVGHDLWSHQAIPSQFRVLSPNEPHRVVVVSSQPTGDVTSSLMVKLDWNIDASVTVHMYATLFDEGEMVADAEKHFNILQNAAVSLKAHLVDKHSGDPDTADIDIVISNAQYA